MTNVNSVNNVSFQSNAYTSHSEETERHIWENVDYMTKNNYSKEKLDAATKLAARASYLLGISKNVNDDYLGQKLDAVITNSDLLISKIARPEQ